MALKKTTPAGRSQKKPSVKTNVRSMAGRRATPKVKSPQSRRLASQPLDRYIGDRLRSRRQLLGMSQTQLAHAIGVSFQQVQKYEKGANRIGSGLLYRLAELLEVPIAYFYEGYDTKMPSGSSGSEIIDRKTATLIRNFNELSPEHKEAVTELIRSLAGKPTPRASRASTAQ